MQRGEGGGESEGGGGVEVSGSGDNTQDDEGATQSSKEFPELEPGANDTSNKDGKKLEIGKMQRGNCRNRQVEMLGN